jgi:putative methylase
MKSESSGWSKKRLAVELSKLKGFEKVDVKLEQYATPSEIAADWLWKAAFKHDIAGKVSLDAACGPGVLGCGALLLGVGKVYFVDSDANALDLARDNVARLGEVYEIGKSEFICADIADFSLPVDVVLQNPPFGTKIRHHDKRFLENAFIVGKTVYSMHKISTAGFVEAYVRDAGFKITDRWEYDFSIGASLPFHRRQKYVVQVGLWRMVKE